MEGILDEAKTIRRCGDAVGIGIGSGLISPTVGLNLNVVDGTAPDIKPKTILGFLPYVGCMVVAIILLCLFPGLAPWLLDLIMGVEL